MAIRLEPLIWVLLGAFLVFRPMSSLRVFTVVAGVILMFSGAAMFIQENRSMFMTNANATAAPFWIPGMSPEFAMK